MMWLVKGILKWSMLAFIWVASLAFAATNTLFMDAFSNVLSDVFGIETTHEKSKNLMQWSSSKTISAASELVARNAFRSDMWAVPFETRSGCGEQNVWAACDVISIQRALISDLHIADEESSADQICSARFIIQ